MNARRTVAVGTCLAHTGGIEMADAASMTADTPYQADDAAALASELFGGKLTVSEVLARLRTRLLDLSMRNRLLNYRQPRGRSFQFTDNPDLDLLYERLEEGKAVQLAYVSDPPSHRYEDGRKPEARVFATETGIGTSVDIDPGRPAGGAGLQALLYPADLERMARKISSEAHTVVEETGTNMLYLMFGFLEYYDRDDSESAVLAPLLSMPINLSRGALDSESRTYTYAVSYSGEDVVANFTLREKLHKQFSLVLPDLDDEDSPCVYVEKIKAAVSRQPKWRVRWRLSLGFLSFGKLAIWADLDPAKSESLLKSELLRNIIEGGRDGASEAFHAEDYDIDRHEDGELPLIYDADSSQHSAIIDVKGGKNLVINGPPGTGKSQTITNIIATALAAGKKVLFVSEKLAALEVVKRNLEKAGLGDFCLEVHSHKTQKKQLLESVAQRMAGTYRAPVGYAQQLQILRERRQALNAYAVLLGSRVGNCLDLTVHEVFWTTERRRQALGPQVDALAGLGLNGVAEWPPQQVERRRRTVADIAAAIGALGCLPYECPWLGFAPDLLVRGDELPISQAVDEGLVHADAMVSAAGALQDALATERWSVKQLAAAADVPRLLQSVHCPAEGGLLQTMFPGGLADLGRAASDVERLSSMLEQIRHLRILAADRLVQPAWKDTSSFQALESTAKRVMSERGLAMSPQDIGVRAGRAFELLAALRSVVGTRDAKIPRDAAALLAAVDAACKASSSAAWVSRSAADLRAVSSRALTVAQEVGANLAEVEGALRASGIPFDGRVNELQELLEGRGMPELVPGAASTAANLERLRDLAKGGWHDWSAERFTATSREINEVLASTCQACEELAPFFARLGIPVETSKTGLQGIEALVGAAEAAPKDLLALRGPGLERADFADIAIRAEDTLRNLSYRDSKIKDAFDLNALPGDEALRTHLQVFRRGDRFFNVLRSDWRQAKAAFNGCSRKKGKFTAGDMADRFSAVLSWKKAVAEFCGNEQFRSAFGALFEGTETDLRKARRLHLWLRTSATSLLTTDLGPHVNLAAIAEVHLNLLASNAKRVRGWLSQIQRATTLAGALPDFAADLSAARRAEDLFRPLGEYAKALGEGAAQLRSVVRPTVSAQRAVEVVDLHQRIAVQGEKIKALVAAPGRLARAGEGIGMSVSATGSLRLRAGIEELSNAAKDLQHLSERLSEDLGDDFDPRSSIEALRAVTQLQELADEFLGGSDVPIQGALIGLVDARERQARLARDLAAELTPRAKPAVSVGSALAGVQASLDAGTFVAYLLSDRAFIERFGPCLKGEETDEAPLRSCLGWARVVEAAAAKLPDTAANRLLRSDAASVASKVVASLQVATAAAEGYEHCLGRLETWGPLDRTVWLDVPLPSDVAKRLRRAREAVATVVPWSKYRAAKEEGAELGLADIVERVERGQLGVDALPAAFEYVFHRSLSREILMAHRDLARFNGAGHESLRAEFAKLDKEVIKLNGQMHAEKVDKAMRPLPGVGSGRVGDLTEMALLHKELSKQKKHIPIRQLLKRAGRSLQALKPCFMMGPLSVAQYLEQGHLKFDLVVMDEASQLRPEDALGAIARGDQLVVVGDPKQLPPTNFFDRLMESDDEDPDDAPSVVDGVESILGIAEHLFRPVRTLRWHYRSKHESLIAFSNARFYDGRLVVFPSPYKRNKRLGVNYRYVSDGLYQDRRNVPEAQRVVDAVIEHMRVCPEESLGVVTLNQPQRELIEDLFDEKSRDESGVAEYLERHEKAGWKFFVKNLENVQGDERDVIFVSTTFGKPPGSNAVRQTFGPINRPDGWRRLNVLFTRARRRVNLFTSMLPADVHVDERASLGRRALREYLEYAKTGLLPGATPTPTGREPDSDFEIAVADALRRHDYEVEPQVGVAGYFIDLCVRHPRRRGEFLAGIECDGATYHSSRSARDRDRIRQEILESLNWRGRIFRVWSTDWFADPNGQTQRLVSLLKRRLEEDEDLPLEPDDEECLFDGDAASGPPGELVDSRDDLPEGVGEATVAPSTAPEVFVDIGDRVTYEVVGELFEQNTVHIVDSPSNPRLGLLHNLTPVAQALLGLCEGDEGSLRVKGQPPRKLRVLRVERLRTATH